MIIQDKRPQPLSGKNVGSFAYATIKDRLPGILTKVIDQFSRLTSKYHDDGEETKADDAKKIVGKLSQMKNEMQTNKPLVELEDSYKDCLKWNEFISNIPCLVEGKETEKGWFDVAWLSCECYMYRRIFSFLQQSSFHKDYDPFLKQKTDAFTSSLLPMKTLAQYVLAFFENKEETEDQLRMDFEMLVEYCLWGNKCDLSISAGIQVYNQMKESSQLSSLLAHIISNHTEKLWHHIRGKESLKRVDFVLDNSGFELFTDLCFAEFLLEKKLCESVQFHVKDIPWFVSDTSKADFLWTIDHCVSNEEASVQALGRRWQARVADGSFVIVNNPYWTLGNDFAPMKEADNDLYQYLSQSDIIIFKGDLNYRKLIGDRNWPHTTPFPDALYGFCPAPLCAMRTLKADLVVGLAEGKAEELQSVNPNWMVTGEYGVIQFCEKI